MDSQSEVIHHQMDETRSALQEKLETLEQQVKNTVQDATEAVSGTVETVKDAVQETVETVKDTVQDTVESVKKTFDISQHVQDHPWAMFLGATAVGFLATRWLARPAPAAMAYSQPIPESPTASRNGGALGGNGLSGSPQKAAASQPAAESSTGNWLTETFHDELAKVKGLAVGALGGVVRDMLTSAVEPTMAEQIKDVVNGFTAKMGGHVMEGPILPPSKPDEEDAKNASREKDDPRSEGRVRETARW